eukprot:760266-Hanusia_phi.AAC.1
MLIKVHLCGAGASASNDAGKFASLLLALAAGAILSRRDGLSRARGGFFIAAHSYLAGLELLSSIV